MVRGPTLESAVLRQLKRIIFTKYITGTSILIVQKWADPGLFFIYFRPFKHKFQFLQQINAHPVNGAGIKTHDLWNMSLLP